MTTQIAREETCFHHIGYSFRIAARVLLYAPSHRQDNIYHILCYTYHGALAGTRIPVPDSMGNIIYIGYLNATLCTPSCKSMWDIYIYLKYQTLFWVMNKISNTDSKMIINISKCWLKLNMIQQLCLQI